ncbi:hypothetical protein [Pigmentibacter ruber]|uniref:hypothetical protein n=1 Tax=Pigmentibacter ruber TaxID=2683196 RepID=UPI00131BD866|nr:hypothetical protein [Pigmentibacter ruber]
MKNILLFILFLNLFLQNKIFSFPCNENLIENKKAPLAYKPFPLLDPDTGKVLAPNDEVQVSDRNGNISKIKAIEFFNQINGMEYSLNQWGYSLRDADGKYNLSQLDICLSLLEKQKEAIDKSMNFSPENSMPSYSDWLKKVTIALKNYQAFTPSMQDLIRIANDRKIDDYLTQIPPFDVPRPPTFKPVELKSFKKEKTWSFEKGQKSKFFVNGFAGYKVAASKIEVSSEANAGLNAAVLGVWEGNIASAKAATNSPGNQNGKLKVTANIFGKTLFAIDQDIGKLGYKEEKTLFDTPIQHEVSTRFTVGPIPVRLAAGIRGQNIMRWGVELVPLQVQSYLQHYAGIDAYASAAVDIYVAGAGVVGRLLLVGIDTRVTAGGFVEFNDVPALKLELQGTTQLNALQGDIRLFVYAYLPSWKFWKGFVERKEWSTSLWSYNGYQVNATIFDYSAKLTPTGFSAKGDLSVEDVQEQLAIDAKLKREEKINNLEFQVLNRISETMNSIANDLHSENNLNLIKSESLIQKNNDIINQSFHDYYNILAKWIEKD